ncbi:hypothetical protein FRC0436_00240 [Corynebacterium diphtheriae]|nr:hypothetical protein FRC0430_00156 [Corynebacterium diphtheriae]CAB0937397.1 hypothetical protein FRC0436_00240 [Corynebacterium diphtheriae]
MFLTSSVSQKVLDALPKDTSDRIMYGNRTFIHSILLGYMLTSHECGSDWLPSFKEVLSDFPLVFQPGRTVPLISPENDMGFPRNWQELSLWNN